MKRDVRVKMLLAYIREYRRMLEILEAEKREAEERLTLLKDTKDTWSVIRRPFILGNLETLFETAEKRFLSLNGVSPLIQEMEKAIEVGEWGAVFEKANAVCMCLENRRPIFLEHSVHVPYGIFIDKVKDLRDFLQNIRFAMAI